MFSVNKISEFCLNLINKNSLFLGGYCNERLQSVRLGRMKKLRLEWSKGPDLLLSRSGHRSVSVGNQIYHLGGKEKSEFLRFNILDP